jgi:DNA-binding MarR family transcriptional regulator
MPEHVRTSNDQPRWLTPAESETWYALFDLLCRLPIALGAQLQQDANLSFVEYYVLARLSNQPEHRTRMSDLAVLVNSELSRLSHLISRLEKRGFVRREPDPANRRYIQAILTDTGYAYLGEAAPGHVARVRELIYDILDPADVHCLGTVSEKIVRRIDRLEREACPQKGGAAEYRPGHDVEQVTGAEGSGA